MQKTLKSAHLPGTACNGVLLRQAINTLVHSLCGSILVLWLVFYPQTTASAQSSGRYTNSPLQSMTTAIVESQLLQADPEKVAGEAAASEVKPRDTVRVTGVRFSYPLIRHWLEVFTASHPEIFILIEPRSTSDPAKFDILVEAYEHDAEIKEKRDYLYIARYLVLPVANSLSSFAEINATKGLTRSDIAQIYFHNLLGDLSNARKVAKPYTVYTRLQKAGAPMVFASCYGFKQVEVRGKAISGSDEHLRQAIIRDTSAVGYLPLPLIYSERYGYPVDGLTVLPIDLNDNGRITEDERIYGEMNTLIERVEEMDTRSVRNLPIGTLHLSVARNEAKESAREFMQWIMLNGMSDLHDFGYLHFQPTPKESVSSGEFAPGMQRTPNR